MVCLSHRSWRVTVFPSLRWAPCPPGLVFPRLVFPGELQQQWGNGHHRLCPLLPLLEDVCLVLDEDGFFSPDPGRRIGWSRASARMGTPRTREKRCCHQFRGSGIVTAAKHHSGDVVLLRRQTRSRPSALLHHDRGSLHHCPSFFALSSNSGLVEGRGPHTQLQGPHLTKCQKHQLGAMRGGSLEGRRQENSLPLVPSGHLHQGRVSRRRTPEKAAMSGRGWSVSKIVGEPAQSALGDPEGPLGGGGLSAGL